MILSFTLVPGSPRTLRVVGRVTIQNRFEALSEDTMNAQIMVERSDVV